MTVRILHWDDERAHKKSLESWLRGLDAHTDTEPCWRNAVSRLIDAEDQYDIVISDMSIQERQYRDLAEDEYPAFWEQSVRQSTRLRRYLESLERFPSDGLRAHYWQTNNLWGTGLLIAAKALGVRELFVVSGFVDFQPESAHPARNVVLALGCAGMLQGGILQKIRSCSWSEERLRAAVMDCEARRLHMLSPSRRSLSTRYIVRPVDGADHDFLVTDTETGAKGPIRLYETDLEVFLTIADASRDAPSGIVSRSQLQSWLNRVPSGGSYRHISDPQIVSSIVDAHDIALLAEDDVNTGLDSGGCRRDNNVLCEWMSGGGIPKGPDEEGFFCAKRGFCPKQLYRRLPKASPRYENVGSMGKLIQLLRRSLTEQSRPFGVDLGSADAKEALLLTVRGEGFALAGRYVLE